MQLEQGDIAVHKLSWKRRLILAFFFIEVIVYPFIVANELESGGFEPDLENRVATRGLTILFVWVPIAVTTGFALGRKLKDRLDIITLFQTRGITADEVPPIIGIFAPLAIVTTVLIVWLAAISIQAFWISIPLYLIIRKWKKKGIRDFLEWCFKLVLRIAIRLKRLSYIGYFLPILFGVWFSNGITKNTQANSGGTFILILIQMVVLVALWKFIRLSPAPAPGGGDGIIQPQPAPLPMPMSQGPIIPPGPTPLEQPLPQYGPLPVPKKRTLPQTPPSAIHPLPGSEARAPAHPLLQHQLPTHSGPWKAPENLGDGKPGKKGRWGR
jgi:hypothetical protein